MSNLRIDHLEHKLRGWAFKIEVGKFSLGSRSQIIKWKRFKAGVFGMKALSRLREIKNGEMTGAVSSSLRGGKYWEGGSRCEMS